MPLLSMCAGNTSSASASSLSRFFFVLGHTAVQHLLLTEKLAKAIRAKRTLADRAAAEAADRARDASAAAGKDQAAGSAKGSGRGKASGANDGSSGGGAEDDIAAQLGIGSVAADAELDAITQSVQAQVGGCWITGGGGWSTCRPKLQQSLLCLLASAVAIWSWLSDRGWLEIVSCFLVCKALRARLQHTRRSAFLHLLWFLNFPPLAIPCRSLHLTSWLAIMAHCCHATAT